MASKKEKSYDLRFQHPATHLVCGPSSAGKTVRVSKILQDKDIIIKNGGQISNVIFCYNVWQPLYDKMKEQKNITKWIKKMPTNNEFIELVEEYKDNGGSIVVIDDFMKDIGEDMDEIIRVSSRHNNTSVFLLFQSLFPPYKLARQISLNMKYLHIHKNPRENSQIGVLARQLRGRDYKWIVDVFYEATAKSYSALLIDLTQEQNDFLRIRSDYLSEEYPMKIWCKKDSILNNQNGEDEEN